MGFTQPNHAQLNPLRQLHQYLHPAASACSLDTYPAPNRCTHYPPPSLLACIGPPAHALLEAQAAHQAGQLLRQHLRMNERSQTLVSSRQSEGIDSATSTESVKQGHLQCHSCNCRLSPNPAAICLSNAAHLGCRAPHLLHFSPHILHALGIRLRKAVLHCRYEGDRCKLGKLCLHQHAVF